MNTVVLDIEIQRSIDELPNGWNDTHLMGVSVAVLYEDDRDTFRVYGPDDLDLLKERLITADRITGFNHVAFDLPVIWGMPRGQRVAQIPEDRCNDLLRRIWQAQGLNPNVFSDRHKGWGLDAVCLATLGRGKTGYGGDAPKWFQGGQWVKLIDYCLQDVALTRDLDRFISRYGYVLGSRGSRLSIPEWIR